MKLPIGSVHGRFQPLHFEHLEYLAAALQRVRFLHVGITQFDTASLLHVDGAGEHRADPRSNPFTYFERAELASLALCGLGTSPERFRVGPFPIERPNDLADFLPLTVPVLTTRVDEWNDSKIAILTSIGYHVEVLYEREPKGVSGAQIRELMATGNPEWESLVPESTVAFLRSLNLSERLNSTSEA